MKKILFAITAMTFLAAAIATQALASSKTGSVPKGPSPGPSHAEKPGVPPGKPGKPGHPGTPPKKVDHHLTHGKKFSHGYYYKGKNHHHWFCQRWDNRYGCICYYDSGCGSWYYWCQPADCYYPVRYNPLGYCTPREPQPTSYTEPLTVQTQTITRTVYATTNIATTPPVPVTNGPQGSNIPPIPAPRP